MDAVGVFVVALNLRSARDGPCRAQRVLEHQRATRESPVRNGRVPRYREIADALRARTAAGALAPGARLDNQRRLAAVFGVTLMTLRQALEVLERERLIARRHGLGTFVAAPSIDYDILQLRRF